nr:probable ribosomal protein S11, mitochondrial [Setaria viridis]
MSFPSSGSVAAYLKPHENFNRTNFVRRDFRAKIQVKFNNMDNGARIWWRETFQPRERLPFSASRVFKEHEQYSQRKKRDFVHVLLKRNKTFVTVMDVSGNKKTGASAGCLEDRKGQSRLSRYAAEATAEHVGRSARKMGLRSVVMKVKGVSFFKKKKVILGWREGFRGERVRDQSPIMYIHDVTQLPHNGCRRPKQRRV